MLKGDPGSVRILAACLALLWGRGAIASDELRSYWFLRNDETQLWCGYSSQARAEEMASAAESITESAKVVYPGAAVAPSTLVHQVESESGDWAVVDEYRFDGDGIGFERSATRLAPFYHIVSAARIGGSHPVGLHRVSITPEGVTAATIGDGPIPELPVKSSINDFPFAALLSLLRSGEREEICTSPNASGDNKAG